MPKSIVVGQEAGSRYELCLMNSSKYEQEFDLELLDEGNPQCYYYASYKKPKGKGMCTNLDQWQIKRSYLQKCSPA